MRRTYSRRIGHPPRLLYTAIRREGRSGQGCSLALTFPGVHRRGLLAARTASPGRTVPSARREGPRPGRGDGGYRLAGDSYVL